MVLASIVSTSQTGSLELLATQLNNPPALANNSGSTVTVSLTATGQWTLINFATSDPSLVKYKTPVDGNGHVRDKNDEKSRHTPSFYTHKYTHTFPPTWILQNPPVFSHFPLNFQESMG